MEEEKSCKQSSRKDIGYFDTPRECGENCESRRTSFMGVINYARAESFRCKEKGCKCYCVEDPCAGIEYAVNYDIYNFTSGE